MYEEFNNLEHFIKFSPAGWTYATPKQKDIINKAVDDAREYAAGSALVVDLVDRNNAECAGDGNFDAIFDVLDDCGKEFNDVYTVLSTYGLEG